MPATPGSTPLGRRITERVAVTAGTTTFTDSGSTAANGACTGDACPAAPAAGHISLAAQYDGVDDRVRVNVNMPAGSYAVAAWVQFSGAAWTNWQTLVEFGDDAPWFGVTPSGQPTLYPAIFGGALPVGQWTHAAYLWNGTESKCYVNGQAVAVNTETGPVVAPPASLPAPGVPPSRFFSLAVSIYMPITTPVERQPNEDIFRLFGDDIYEVTNAAHKMSSALSAADQQFSPIVDVSPGTASSQTANPGTPLIADLYVDATLDEVEDAVLFDGSESTADLTFIDPDGLTTGALPAYDSDGYDMLYIISLSQPAAGT